MGGRGAWRQKRKLIRSWRVSNSIHRKFSNPIKAAVVVVNLQVFINHVLTSFHANFEAVMFEVPVFPALFACSLAVSRGPELLTQTFGFQTDMLTQVMPCLHILHLMATL